jgi:hypothetical protein
MVYCCQLSKNKTKASKIMAIEKVHPTKGSTNSRSRRDKRAVVKVQAKKARRNQDKTEIKIAAATQPTDAEMEQLTARFQVIELTPDEIAECEAWDNDEWYNPLWNNNDYVDLMTDPTFRG